jgi:hypothetical protein
VRYNIKCTKNEYLVMMRLRVTPVPIPNTKVKTYTVDGTAWEAEWESRWLPGENIF